MPEDSPQGSPTSALQHLLLLCVSAWHFFPFNPTQYSAGGLGGGTGRSRKGLPRGLAEQTSCCAVLWLLSGAQAASSSNGKCGYITPVPPVSSGCLPQPRGSPPFCCGCLIHPSNLFGQAIRELKFPLVLGMVPTLTMEHSHILYCDNLGD